jgi:preprotein translocase subunit SecD
MILQTSGPAAPQAPPALRAGPGPTVGAGEREPATPPVTGAPDTGADRHDPAPTTRPPTPTPPQEASSDAGHGKAEGADANRPGGPLSPRRPSGAFQVSRPAASPGKPAAGRASTAKPACSEHSWRIKASRRVRGVLIVTWKCLDCQATKELQGTDRP